jgi:hypothetical protein
MGLRPLSFSSLFSLLDKTSMRLLLTPYRELIRAALSTRPASERDGMKGTPMDSDAPRCDEAQLHRPLHPARNPLETVQSESAG